MSDDMEDMTLDQIRAVMAAESAAAAAQFGPVPGPLTDTPFSVERFLDGDERHYSIFEGTYISATVVEAVDGTLATVIGLEGIPESGAVLPVEAHLIADELRTAAERVEKIRPALGWPPCRTR